MGFSVLHLPQTGAPVGAGATDSGGEAAAAGCACGMGVPQD